MADHVSEVQGGNVDPGSIALAERAAAQSKLSDQYVVDVGRNAPGPEGMNPNMPEARGAGGMGKAEMLEQQGILPPGATILYDGPAAGGGNRHETCFTTPTTESITPMPDGSRVITDTSTTVCTPNGEVGGAGHGPEGGVPMGSSPKFGFGPAPHEGESFGSGAAAGAPFGPGQNEVEKSASGPHFGKQFESGPHQGFPANPPDGGPPGPILNKGYGVHDQAPPPSKQQ